MAKSRSTFLRLYAEQASPASTLDVDVAGLWGQLCPAFEQATGWALRFVDQESGESSEPLWSLELSGTGSWPGGQLRIESAAEEAAAPMEHAAALAGQIGNLVNRLARSEQALGQREAELAAQVPVVPHRDEPQHLAERLQAVLQGGARSVGCQTAALYTLDPATTELKLRSAWGLPAQRFTLPARRLRDTVADLEALAGHAVVLETARQAATWQPPEAFPAAVCVPVSTATTPLGTLWMFCGRERPFSDDQVNLVEIVAGRLAAELEREVLWQEGVEGAQLRRQWSAAERWQQQHLPHVSPLCDAWQVAGWSHQARGVGGALHDWFLRDDGTLIASLVACEDQNLAAALTAATVRGALRTSGLQSAAPGQLLDAAQQVLWTGSAGDQRAAAVCLQLPPQGNTALYSVAGDVLLCRFGPGGFQPCEISSPQLGCEPETCFGTLLCELASGEGLLALAGQTLELAAPQRRRLTAVSLAHLLNGYAATSDLGELVDVARDRIEHLGQGCPTADYALLAVRRQR